MSEQVVVSTKWYARSRYIFFYMCRICLVSTQTQFKKNCIKESYNSRHNRIAVCARFDCELTCFDVGWVFLCCKYGKHGKSMAFDKNGMIKKKKKKWQQPNTLWCARHQCTRRINAVLFHQNVSLLSLLFIIIFYCTLQMVHTIRLHNLCTCCHSTKVKLCMLLRLLRLLLFCLPQRMHTHEHDANWLLDGSWTRIPFRLIARFSIFTSQNHCIGYYTFQSPDIVTIFRFFWCCFCLVRKWSEFKKARWSWWPTFHTRRNANIILEIFYIETKTLK